MAELGIRIEHLRKRYGEGDTAVDALKDVNMTVAPGACRWAWWWWKQHRSRAA